MQQRRGIGFNGSGGRSRLSVSAIVVGIVAGWAGWGLAAQDIDLQQLRNQGQALFEEKETAAAGEVFARVTESAEATAADWLNLALARYELGGSEAGDDQIFAAIDAAAASGESPRTHFLRGLTHARRGRNAVAAREFGAAASLDPTDPASLYNWGSTLQAIDDVDGALEQYARVIAMEFDVAQQFFVSSLYRTGRILMLRDGVEAARPYIERYQRAQPRQSQAQRAATALEAGRYKRVVVPRTSLAAAAPETAAAIDWVAGATISAVNSEERPLALADFGADYDVVLESRGPADGAIQLNGLGTLAVGDMNRDGIQEVATLDASGAAVWRTSGNEAAPDLVPIEVEGLPAFHATDAHWVDADHDGDLDLMATTPADGHGFRWFANHGGGLFVEVTESAGLGGPPAVALSWADFDDDNDVDFYVVRADGTGALYSNARGGEFVEIAEAVGAAGPGGVRAAVAEDINNDGWFDIVTAGLGVATLINHGDGTFAARAVGAGMAEELFSADLNNDGWLDLVADTGVAWINTGDGFDAYAAIVEQNARVRALADANGDGAIDALLAEGETLRWALQREPVGAWARVALEGVKANLLGVGSTLEAKAGGLYQRRLLRDRWAHFGLGGEDTIDVLRITWPNGIIQNSMAVAANAAVGPIGEVERLEGSCPLLYTWDGTRWRFINEVLGVAPLGMPLAVDVIHPADFDEYVPVPSEALRLYDGAYEIRLTEELREAGYLDTVRLVAVDRPLGTQVFPDERFVPPPHPEFGIYAVDEPRAVRARDADGTDWSSALAAVDGRRAQPFALDRYEGLATPHSLELDLPDADGALRPRLFLTGWIYWATGSINLVVDEDPRVRFAPVTLEVPDGAGGWRVAIEDIGLPNAKNSTLVVELADALVPGDPRVRLTTTMRLYWDAAFYTVADGASLYRPTGNWAGDWGVPREGVLPLATGPDSLASDQLRVNVLAPDAAEIRWRGFSALERDADGFETFVYEQTAPVSNWDQHPGNYTRYGDVRELVDSADDELVVIGTGDEVAIRFRDTLPPLPEGWRRDWLVYLNGWVKDGDPNTVGGDRVEPLPYHGMGTYPPAPIQHEAVLAGDVAEPAWRERYNTRPARRVNAPLRPR